ncbi:hypothetical protein PF008_g8035 [Phytophthora fragariae]|uniref:Uncharacterized protein n=1 Tax=Phytophthora fragariae TaxID=53985 RepID=A0A6G0S0P9_9STRA|nr:hypothetical protein PF008_g8035 [Phytophthora fragariae]
MEGRKQTAKSKDKRDETLSDEESDIKPQMKMLKAAVRQVTPKDQHDGAKKKRVSSWLSVRTAGALGDGISKRSQLLCVHEIRTLCEGASDAEAKNDQYTQQRGKRQKNTGKLGADAVVGYGVRCAQDVLSGRGRYEWMDENRKGAQLLTAQT